MLVINKEQMEKFRVAGLHRFEDEMLAHLKEFSPPLFKALGEEQMRKAVHFGITQAFSHGFNLRGPVRLYLELMVLFGSYFDTDPQYPWAAKILADQDEETQMQRAERLYEKILDYRQKVAGPEDAYSLAALKNVAIFLRQPLSIPSEHFISAMLQEISFLYPQKAAYVGNENLEALIRKGIGGAQKQHFSTVQGGVLVVLLMLAFGHGCGTDPLYPWILQTLRDEAITDHGTRAKRLEEKTLGWIEYALTSAGKELQA